MTQLGDILQVSRDVARAEEAPTFDQLDFDAQQSVLNRIVVPDAVRSHGIKPRVWQLAQARAWRYQLISRNGRKPKWRRVGLK